MAQTVGEYLLRRLQAWGVRRVFGYPRDGIAQMDHQPVVAIVGERERAAQIKEMLASWAAA